VRSKGTNYRRGASIFGRENPTLQEVTSLLASFQSSVGWITFKRTPHSKVLTGRVSLLWFPQCIFCECWSYAQNIYATRNNAPSSLN